MAKNSALLFYQEHKAKRLKKIKSKAYHRHLKKKAAKAMPADDEASQQVRPPPAHRWHPTQPCPCRAPP